jgi:hypothetical protein
MANPSPALVLPQPNPADAPGVRHRGRAAPLVTTAAVVLAVAIAYLQWGPSPIPTLPPVFYGLLAVLVMYALSAWITGSASPFQAAMGADGRLSTSKFQFLLWTWVVVFVYAWFYAARAQSGHFEPINDLPANVLLAMGISVTTLASAKAITTSYVLDSRVEKPAQNPAEASAKDLVTNDNQGPEITKIQMLIWTLVAAAVYVAAASHAAQAYASCTIVPNAALPPECQFPDIDPALMVLMGLGQAAYLGNKLVTTTTPRPVRAEPATGGWGTVVKVKGAGFGTTPQWVTVNDTPIAVAADGWKDDEVVVTIPRKRPSDGSEWSVNETLRLGVLVGGQRSASVASFVLAGPEIRALDPATGTAGSAVKLKGAGFGPEQSDSAILIDGVVSKVPVASWSDTEIAITLPTQRAPGAVRIGLHMYGKDAASEKTFTIT